MSRAVEAFEHADFPWGAVTIVLVLAVLFGALARLGAQPLRLEVYGEIEHADVAAMTETMAPLLRQGFFGLRERELEESLRNMPWVRKSDSELLWPNRLAVHLVEHRVVARMEAGGVLVDGGEVIDASVAGDLPVVRSTPSRTADIASVLKLVQSACPGCQISRLELRPGDQLHLSLQWQENPVDVELGRPKWEPALRRLTEHALPELGGRLADVALIDLRHRHAYAVRWRNKTQQESLS